jgi:hypothetical protein
MEKNLLFLCSSDDYHAIDWFRTVKKVAPKSKISIVVDNLDFNNPLNLINKNDSYYVLLNIERFLIFKNSNFSDFFRNLIKLIAIPVQVFRLKRLSKKVSNCLFHAHSMYYIFMCWLAGVKFVATPMGSDVLVRPNDSFLYKFFTIKSLRSAYIITVDSEKMFNKIFELTKKKSRIIQNGIDTREVLNFKNLKLKRNEITSIRALYPNYQISKILNSRNSMKTNKIKINLIYPFFEKSYYNNIKKKLIIGDKDLGRLNKKKMFQILWKSKIVFSIPLSDSSPRSVYEAIFCGCIIITNYSKWIDLLPNCMFERIVIADLNDPEWFTNSVSKANSIVKNNFIPSNEAFELFDQYESMKIMCRDIYKI